MRENQGAALTATSVGPANNDGDRDSKQLLLHRRNDAWSRLAQ